MSESAKRGDWVCVHQVVLEVEERAPDLPDETRKVSLDMRVKGFLQEEQARIGDPVHITTLIGRPVHGRLEAINPEYGHSFARAVPELLTIGGELRQLLEGGDA